MPDLSQISLKIQNYKCFADEAQGFNAIKPINLIIGRNNSGKSALLDLVQESTRNSDLSRYVHYAQAHQQPWIVIEAPTETRLRDTIIEGSTFIQGSNQLENAMATSRITWRRHQEKKHFQGFEPSLGHLFPSHKHEPLLGDYCLIRQSDPFAGLQFRRLSPDRDVKVEADHGVVELGQNGAMATTIIQHFLLDEDRDRKLVEEMMLRDLNTILRPDGNFTRLIPQRSGTNQYELLLEEGSKGSIRLADSGHGLKTVLLVLANIYICPVMIGEPLSNFLFGFEELENNMHPALFRRLLTYLQEKAINEKFSLFLTSHSHVAIDIFAHDEQAQILHVTHDGQHATVRAVDEYLHHRDILNDLDVRASDLLQSNSIVWVEGPSDRLYFNKWMQIFNSGKMREGIHYQCVFYGGSLLARLRAGEPEEDVKDEYADLVNLMNINRHAILLMDSDRENAEQDVNGTKQRIMEEITAMGGMAWITNGREVENYLPQVVLETLYPEQLDEELSQFEDIGVYLNNAKVGEGKRFEANKVAFAQRACRHFDDQDIAAQLRVHLDIKEKMEQACSLICLWNGKREEPVV